MRGFTAIVAGVPVSSSNGRLNHRLLQRMAAAAAAAAAVTTTAVAVAVSAFCLDSRRK